MAFRFWSGVGLLRPDSIVKATCHTLMRERHSTASFGKCETRNGLAQSVVFGVVPWVTNGTADEAAASCSQPVVLETAVVSCKDLGMVRRMTAFPRLGRLGFALSSALLSRLRSQELHVLFCHRYFCCFVLVLIHEPEG